MWLKSNTTPKWLINISFGITSGCQLARAKGPALSHLVWSANAATYPRSRDGEGSPRSVAGQRFILNKEGGTSASLP